MSLDSIVKKILAIGTISTVLLFNPLSKGQEIYAQTTKSPTSGTLEMESNESLKEKYVCLYDLIIKNYNVDLGNAVFEGSMKYPYYFAPKMSRPFYGINMTLKNVQIIMNNSELKKYPIELSYALIRSPSVTGSNLNDTIALCFEIDQYLMKKEGTKYNKEKAVKKMCDMLDLFSESNIRAKNMDYFLEKILEDNLYSPLKNLDVLMASAVGTKEIKEIVEFGNYLITEKKYSPDVAGAVLVAYGRGFRSKEDLYHFVDVNTKGSDDILKIGIINAFGFGSKKKNIGTSTEYATNDFSNILKISMYLYLTKKYDSKAMSLILEACALDK